MHLPRLFTNPFMPALPFGFAAALTGLAVLLLAPLAPAATLPFNTTFANDTTGQLPAGWTADLVTPPTVTTAQFAPGDLKSVVFNANNQGMEVALGTNNVIQWDFWVRPAGTGRSITAGTFDNAGHYGIWLTWGNTSGQISYYANGAWNAIPGVSFAANQWYKVRLVGRLSPAKSFDFYMSAAGSGALPALPQGRNLPLRDAATTSFVTAHVGTYGFANIAYFDDSAVHLPVLSGFDTDTVGTGFPAGWTPTGTAPQIVTPGADASPNSLSIFSNGNRLELPFALTDAVTVDLKVYPTGLGRTLTFTVFDQSHRWGPYLALGANGTGQLNYYATNAWSAVPGVTFTSNAWYRIRVVARNQGSSTFDVYVSAANSDVLPGSPQGVNLPVRDPAAMDFAAFGLDSSGLTAACKVDSVEITHGLEPVVPLPVEPANNSTTYQPTPSLRWYEAWMADRYETQIATDAAFSNVIDTDSIVINRYVHDQALPTGDIYWRVRSRSVGGLASAYSPGQKLTIQTPTNVYSIAANATAAQVQTIISGATTPAVVNFAAGANYVFAPTSYLITLSSKNDLIINGNGASITFTNPMAGLASLNNCQRVLIRDLSVDFNPVPFSVGTIIATNSNGEFTMTLDSGMPPFNAPHMVTNWTWGVLLDPTDPGKMLPGAPIVFNTVSNYVLVNGNQYTLKHTTPVYVGYFKLGAKYIQFARNNAGRNLLSATACSNLTCLSITNYAISAGHYMLLDATDCKVLRCHSRVKSGRWFGGNADGIHARFNLTGPWVEGCEFYGLGDDAIALFSKGVFIQQKISNNLLRLGTEYFNYTNGSQFTIFNPRDGLAVAENLTVTAVTNVGGAYDVAFTPAVAATIVTTNADPLLNDQVFNRTRVHSGFAIRGNDIHNIRRYGSVIRASYGVIENNLYEGISDVPIFFRNEPDTWRNGLHSADVLITGNCITNSGFAWGGQNMGQIQMSLYKLGSQFGAWRAHQRIQISDNEIWNWQDRGITLRNARDINVSRNLITAAPGVTFNNTRPHYGIYVDNAQDSLISSNNIADPRPLTAPVLVTNSVSIIVQP
jgi:hypothetical protein